MILLFSFIFYLLLLIITYYFLLLNMVHTIDTLKLRIDFLEIHILSLLSFKVPVKNKHTNGFKLFSQAVRPHVRSYLFKENLQITGNNNFNPKNTDIIKEISAMWNDLSLEEKFHWAHIASF